MTMTYNTPSTYISNQKGAKEASEFLSKPFKLEQALYTKVKEHEQQEVTNLAPKTSREKKAVDFFLRRRVRCDKYVKESVAPAKDDDLTEEERAKLEEERLQAEFKAKQKRMDVEVVEVKPMKGEIKMPAMTINSENNGNTATPFGSQRASQQSQAWSSVKFGSVSDGINSGMINSVMSGSCMSKVWIGKTTSQCRKFFERNVSNFDLPHLFFPLLFQQLIRFRCRHSKVRRD